MSDLQRFVDAQRSTYTAALDVVRVPATCGIGALGNSSILRIAQPGSGKGLPGPPRLGRQTQRVHDRVPVEPIDGRSGLSRAGQPEVPFQHDAVRAGSRPGERVPTGA